MALEESVADSLNKLVGNKNITVGQNDRLTNMLNVINKCPKEIAAITFSDINFLEDLVREHLSPRPRSGPIGKTF